MALLASPRPETQGNPVEIAIGLSPQGELGITPFELREIIDRTHKFAQSPEVDSISRSCYENPHQYPDRFLELLVENGFTRWVIPEKYGGDEAHPLAKITFMEEMSRKDSGLALNALVQMSLVMNPLIIGGNEEQINRWLPRLTNGDLRGCFALTEPRSGGGTDATNLTTRAEMIGDHWEITGQKTFITAADGASFIILAARTGLPNSGKNGISVFAFEIPSEGLPGLVIDKPMKKDGQYSSQMCSISFDRVRIPKNSLLGEINKGWNSILERTLLESRDWIAAQGNGLSIEAYDLAIKEAERHLIRGKPLIEFETNINILNHMAQQINKSRYLAMKAAMKLWQNDPHYATWASLAKYVSGETAPIMALLARRMFGGYGLMDEFSVRIAQIKKDADFIATYEGAEEVQIGIALRDLRQIGITREQFDVFSPPSIGSARLIPYTEYQSFEEFVELMNEWDSLLSKYSYPKASA